MFYLVLSRVTSFLSDIDGLRGFAILLGAADR